MAALPSFLIMYPHAKPEADPKPTVDATGAHSSTSHILSSSPPLQSARFGVYNRVAVIVERASDRESAERAAGDEMNDEWTLCGAVARGRTYTTRVARTAA
eukprot:CAMPEP_0119511614 /NCGR_PEP_ID=MMETSP1344-20130328/30229_1 /TAXON_ID=236787 /ORGANISM="Florenciella parvula, Strain CCMP2471" /LENGTH=100 /DNA_ID=CAMNT_0007548643 /DNA_START=423 /DNA_END=722 /DNA_ORIENTATION=+